VLAGADPIRKREVYRQLQLQATYYPGKRQVRIEANLDPHRWGYGKCPRTILLANHNTAARVAPSQRHP